MVASTVISAKACTGPDLYRHNMDAGLVLEDRCILYLTESLGI